MFWDPGPAACDPLLTCGAREASEKREKSHVERKEVEDLAEYLTLLAAENARWKPSMHSVQKVRWMGIHHMQPETSWKLVLDEKGENHRVRYCVCWPLCSCGFESLSLLFMYLRPEIAFVWGWFTWYGFNYEQVMMSHQSVLLDQTISSNNQLEGSGFQNTHYFTEFWPGMGYLGVGRAKAAHQPRLLSLLRWGHTWVQPPQPRGRVSRRPADTSRPGWRPSCPWGPPSHRLRPHRPSDSLEKNPGPRPICTGTWSVTPPSHLQHEGKKPCLLCSAEKCGSTCFNSCQNPNECGRTPNFEPILHSHWCVWDIFSENYKVRNQCTQFHLWISLPNQFRPKGRRRHLSFTGPEQASLGESET